MGGKAPQGAAADGMRPNGEIQMQSITKELLNELPV